VRLGQFLDATARAKQFVTQSEYPLRVGKSAVPVVVPVMPKLTPEVLEDKDDEGGGVDSEEGMVDEDELVSVWQFAPRTRESKKAMQVNVAFVKTLWERIPLQFPAEARWRWTDSGNP